MQREIEERLTTHKGTITTLPITITRCPITILLTTTLTNITTTSTTTTSTATTTGRVTITTAVTITPGLTTMATTHIQQLVTKVTKVQVTRSHPYRASPQHRPLPLLLRDEIIVLHGEGV